MSKRPNVLFVLSDQHNAKVLGHKGHPDVLTPNLDRMAAQGVRFENAIAQNPICTPSRVSYLTGQYPHNHGYYALGGPQPERLPNLIGHFCRHGYRTAAIGTLPGPASSRTPDPYDEAHPSFLCERDGSQRFRSADIQARYRR